MSVKPYAVVRATTIAAPAATIRRELENLREWRRWSPWPPIDAATVVRFTGPESGVGARMEWDDDPRLGRGHVELAEAHDAMVVFDMDSEQPRSSGNVMVFLLADVGGATRLTWTMHGEVDGIRKVTALVWPMDKAVGPSFTRGLARLKTIVESRVA